VAAAAAAEVDVAMSRGKKLRYLPQNLIVGSFDAPTGCCGVGRIIGGGLLDVGEDDLGQKAGVDAPVAAKALHGSLLLAATEGHSHQLAFCIELSSLATRTAKTGSRLKDSLRSKE